MRGSVKRIRPSPVSLIIFKKMSVHNVHIYIYLQYKRMGNEFAENVKRGDK